MLALMQLVFAKTVKRRAIKRVENRMEEMEVKILSMGMNYVV